METFLSERKKSKEQIQVLVADTNLKEYFTDEEIAKILQVETGSIPSMLQNEKRNSKSESESKKVNSFLLDRTNFIVKLLKLCKEKLNSSKEITLAKGLRWLSHEIQDSILFKTDEQSIKKLEELKKENKDLQTVFSWLEEYSTIKLRGKDGSSKTKLKELNMNGTYNSHFETRNHNLNLNNLDNNLDDSSLDSGREEIKYINFSEDSIKKIEDPSFDIFKLEREVGEENILSTISCYIFTTMGFYSTVKYDKFEMFIQEIAKGYSRANSYHNDLHAADVLQTCSIFLKWGQIANSIKLCELDVCALLISSIIHDYKHPGVTNLFLINTANPIAIKYNDVSVLENYHVSSAFKLIKSNEQYNIFSDLSKEEYKTMRKRIVESVLATDMTFHAKQFTYLKLKIESLNIKKGENVDKVFDGLDKMAIYNTQQEFLNIIIHACDISNPTKPFDIYKEWANRVMTEFWTQGDQEKTLGLPVSFLCDRTTVTIPSAQIGFIDGIVTPFITAFQEFFPGVAFLIDNIADNKSKFKQLKDEEEAKKK